jgi:hypothetical protein
MGGAAAQPNVGVAIAALREHGTRKSREPADKNVCATFFSRIWSDLVGSMDIGIVLKLAEKAVGAPGELVG